MNNWPSTFKNINKYLRDLTYEDNEQQAFERLKSEVQLAFSTSDASYKTLTASEVIARNSQ